MSKLVFVTGVSSGFGRALAQAAVTAGFRVAGTVRSLEQAAAFAALDPDSAHPQLLDVADTAAIDAAVVWVERAEAVTRSTDG